MTAFCVPDGGLRTEMRTKEVLVLTTRLRSLILTLAALSLGASFADNSSRSLLVLPNQPRAAFASVTEPTGTAYSAGYLVEAVPVNSTAVRRARRLIPNTISQTSRVNIPRPVASLSGTVDPVIPASGLSVPEIRSFMPLPVAPSNTTPEPPAWILALAGVAVLAAFRYRNMLTGGHRGAGLA
jgi:hypothetical protein